MRPRLTPIISDECRRTYSSRGACCVSVRAMDDRRRFCSLMRWRRFRLWLTGGVDCGNVFLKG